MGLGLDEVVAPDMIAPLRSHRMQDPSLNERLARACFLGTSAAHGQTPLHPIVAYHQAASSSKEVIRR